MKKDLLASVFSGIRLGPNNPTLPSLPKLSSSKFTSEYQTEIDILECALEVEPRAETEDIEPSAESLAVVAQTAGDYFRSLTAGAMLGESPGLNLESLLSLEKPRMAIKQRHQTTKQIQEDWFPRTENIVDKETALLWDDKKMAFVKGDWRDKFIAKSEAELQELCRADDVGGLRWFPTSVDDGEWLAISCIQPVNGYVTCNNGVQFSAVISRFDSCYDLGFPISKRRLLHPIANTEKAYSIHASFFEWVILGFRYGDILSNPDSSFPYLCFAGVPRESVMDFIAVNGGEITGPKVVNGFFALFDVDIEEWEPAQVDKFGIELDE